MFGELHVYSTLYICSRNFRNSSGKIGVCFKGNGKINRTTPNSADTVSFNDPDEEEIETLL